MGGITKMEKSGVEILGHPQYKNKEAWGKKKRRGDTEIQNNGAERRVGLLFFCSIERGFNGSRLTVHRWVVLI